MAALTVKIPESLKSFVKEQVSQGDYDGPSDFVTSLVRAARRQKAEERLLALVKEADESGPPTPMTKQDWEDIRREGMRRLAQEKGAHAKRRKTARSRR